MKSNHVFNWILALIVTGLLHAIVAGKSDPTMTDVAALWALVAALEAHDASDTAERIEKDMP